MRRGGRWSRKNGLSADLRNGRYGSHRDDKERSADLKITLKLPKPEQHEPELGYIKELMFVAHGGRVLSEGDQRNERDVDVIGKLELLTDRGQR